MRDPPKSKGCGSDQRTVTRATQSPPADARNASVTDMSERGETSTGRVESMNVQRVGAIAAFGSVVGLYVVAVVFSIVGDLGPVWEFFAFGTWLFAFAGVGVLIVFRRPGNAIAWLCLGFALVWAINLAADTL